MRAVFKVTKNLWDKVHRDIVRPCNRARERVGFLSCKVTTSENGTLIILAYDYHPVSDEHYSLNSAVGACINEEAIRMALQVSLSAKCSMFHVHLHPHKGLPKFSSIDVESNCKLIPDFFGVTSHMPHGAVVFSFDKGEGLLWTSKESAPIPIDEFVVVGNPISIWWPRKSSSVQKPDRDFSRQSFLGAESEEILSQVKVGVVGLGGGGSQIVQQLAHAGVGRYAICDYDRVEESNLNRLVGATVSDAECGRLKTKVADRLIKGVMPDAEVNLVEDKWSGGLKSLSDCLVIFGCADSLKERDELERFCRRNLILYIDIGMDVHKSSESFRVAGQVISSIPDEHCFRCMRLLDDECLESEKRLYGAAGHRPQVIWSNGVLASSAVGIFMNIVCPWHDDLRGPIYQEYSGNGHILTPCGRYERSQKKCPHYQAEDVGDALFNKSDLSSLQQPHQP